MKLTSLHAAALAALFAALFALSAVAQTQQAQPAEGGGAPEHNHFYPAPTNLKVLPKNLTGEQVREIMEGWAGSLGVHCDTCHQADPHKIGLNGRPRLNFPDDSKPEKSTARLMFKMTGDINGNYVSMVPVKEGEPAPKVTCGTCHRGHKDPEAFVIPPREGGMHWEQGPEPAETAPTTPK